MFSLLTRIAKEMTFTKLKTGWCRRVRPLTRGRDVIPCPPRVSFPSGGVRKSMPKKDIQGGHPGGFEPLTSEPPSLNGLVAHPLNPHKIQSKNPKSKLFGFGFWILEFAILPVFGPTEEKNYWAHRPGRRIFCACMQRRSFKQARKRNQGSADFMYIFVFKN